MSKTLRKFDAKSWAAHYARTHYQTDPGIVEIHFLPTGSPPDELRMVMVNKSLMEINGAASEPLTMGVDIGGDCPHYLSIIDITPSQWAEIKADQLSLPEGWSLVDGQKLPKARRR